MPNWASERDWVSDAGNLAVTGGAEAGLSALGKVTAPAQGLQPDLKEQSVAKKSLA